MNSMQAIIIRQVRPEDLDAVTEVEAGLLPKGGSSDRASFEARIKAFPDSFFVAEEEGRIVGFINGAVVNETTIRDEMFEDVSFHNGTGNYQSIFGLDVIPEYQHHGLASRLMRHMIEETKKRGKQGLILTCKDRLIGFYETFGYRNLGVSESVHGGAVWYDMILELEA